MYLCDEPVRGTRSNAAFCSDLCRNRDHRLHRDGEVSIWCPRCGGYDYILTLAGDDCCLRCGYATGATLSLDGVRIFTRQYAKSA